MVVGSVDAMTFRPAGATPAVSRITPNYRRYPQVRPYPSGTSAEPYRKGGELAAPPAGPVADFCIELRLLVRRCGVRQQEIADALGLSVSSVSELLGGRRRTVPDWVTVRQVVERCARRAGAAPPTNMNLDIRWWKSRHAELERTAETARERNGRAPARIVPSALPKLDVMDCVDMGVEEAVRLLAADRTPLTAAVESLMNPPDGELSHPSDGDQWEPRILRDLLGDFPVRVRAARGTDRAALIQAARVVLVAAVVVMEPGREQVHGLILDLADGTHVPHSSPLGEFEHRIDADTADRITNRYLRLALPLARTCPEFALAAGVPGVAASSPYTTGLAGLGDLLSEFAASDRRHSPYHALLRDPIVSLDSLGPRSPSLAEGYVTPRFRLAPASEAAHAGIASDKWWEEQPTYDDIERFLAAHILGLPGLLAPLVVLGHPGGGKSLLTKLLMAQLQPAEFRPLRVELRHTPAEKGVQAQLEHALLRETGRRTTWPDWSEEEPGPIPVVLLDGFDELLQAGSQRLGTTGQWHYLQEVKEFQKREARLGRPVVVILTSRTVVADRASIPTTSPVIRLEPFDEPEIERWINVWNTTNAAYFGRQGLCVFLPEIVAPHRELAAQPLLLLMLALYDGIGNALHPRRSAEMSRTELYDSLLTEFVRRQVVKDGPLPPADTATAVERELRRLSVIALSMFHRGAQSISGEETHRDLHALGALPTGERDDSSGLLFGRFFFVHEAQAIASEERLRSYEFMHATFGEHLVARLIEQALDRFAGGPSTADDGELYALLSFTPLTDRAQIVQNLRDMLAAWPRERVETSLLPGLADLFHAAAWDPERRVSVGYAPVRLRRAYRDAAYEVNLVLIAVLAAGELYVSEFMASAEGEGIDLWRQHTLIWQALLSAESWAALTSALVPERCWRTDPRYSMEAYRDLRVTTNPARPADHDLNWWERQEAPPKKPRPLSDGLEDRFSSPIPGVPDLIRRVSFTGDRDAELLLHIGQPLLLQLPSTVFTSTRAVDERTHSPAQSLTALLTRDVYPPAVLPDLYIECLAQVGMLSLDERAPYLETVLCHLAHDAPALADDALVSVLRELPQAQPKALVLTEAADRALLNVVVHALDRGSIRLAAPLAELLAELQVAPGSAFLPSLYPDSDVALHALLALTRLSRSTHTWLWLAHAIRQDAAPYFHALLEHLDLPSVADTHPSALIDFLRLVTELGMDDWVAAYAPKILAALPTPAFGLLRPSDLPRLRKALPEGAYAEEFNDVERAWRGPEITAP